MEIGYEQGSTTKEVVEFDCIIANKGTVRYKRSICGKQLGYKTPKTPLCWYAEADLPENLPWQVTLPSKTTHPRCNVSDHFILICLICQ